MTTMPEAAPTTIGPAAHPVRSFGLGEVLSIIVAAVVAGAAVGYLLAHYDGDTDESLARIAGGIGGTAVVLMIYEARRRTRIDQVRERLDRIEAALTGLFDAELIGYNRGYMDCLLNRSRKD